MLLAIAAEFRPVDLAALTGVYARLIRDGEPGRACRAAQLRGRLPVGRHVS